MNTLNDDAWKHYLHVKNIKFDEPTYYVDAAELKQLTNREPRLLAKFDTPDQLPKPLKEAGYTLLPIKNGKYQLVHGTLFVSLPPCRLSYNNFEPRISFPLTTEGRGQGESQYIDQAFNSGLLHEFFSISEMYQTIRGREYTKRFYFQWDAQLIEVESVQIEVDAGYESLDEIVLVEAKIGVPSHFNLRQLYYPYRHFLTLAPQKRIRTVFLAYDLPTTSYHLFEYKFDKLDNPLSGFIERCGVYRVSSTVRQSIHALIDVRFQSASKIVPQADDLNKVYEILLLVEADIDNAENVADYFGFDERQSSYYREAAEYLGLLEGYKLTEMGIALLSISVSEQSLFLAKGVVNSWIFCALIAVAVKHGSFTRKDIENTITSAKKADGSQYSASTVKRRSSTIVSWLNWLAQEFDCFTIEKNVYRLR